MRNLNLLVWLTQLGLSVAVPLAGFVLAAVWMQQKWNLGVWIIFVGAALGIYCAVKGLRQSLKMLADLSKDREKNKPPISFNDHE